VKAGEQQADVITQSMSKLEIAQAAPPAAGTKKLASPNNEESSAASTSHSSVKADNISAKQSPQKTQEPTTHGKLVNGTSAPPVPSFTAQGEGEKRAGKLTIPALRYRPIFSLPRFYIKFMESVYEGYENFSFNELNYEITQKDIKFLMQANASGLLNLT
jgi:hypothetical protein